MLGKILTFSLRKRTKIRFWYDPATETLYVQHVRSGTIETIEDPSKITHFLGAYNLKLSNCIGIKEDEDKLGLRFKLLLSLVLTNEKGAGMKKAVVFDQNIEDQSISFVVIVCKHNGQWLFCKHKDRTTFEVPGGRRETGETIWETAHRELFEESGATKYELHLIDKYYLNIDNEIKQGALFYASITELSPLPESEIDSIQLFDDVPPNLTYPEVQHELMTRLRKPQLVGGGQFD